MMKKACNKCKRLNILKMNIILEGSGRINTKCQYCGSDIYFSGKNKINIKATSKEVVEKEVAEREAIMKEKFENEQKR